MIAIGTIKQGWEIGKIYYEKYIWHTCELCGKERWVCIRKSRPQSKACNSCAKKGHFGKANNAWKSGRWIGRDGYVRVYKPEHPHANKGGSIKQAVLVLEEKLGRYLLLGMDSHHKNGIRDDDNPGNLEERTCSEHMRLHRMRGK